MTLSFWIIVVSIWVILAFIVGFSIRPSAATNSVADMREVGSALRAIADAINELALSLRYEKAPRPPWSAPQVIVSSAASFMGETPFHYFKRDETGGFHNGSIGITPKPEPPKPE